MSNKKKKDRRARKSHFQVGYQWEREVFGKSAADFPTPAYLPFDEAFADAKRRQEKDYGWNPENPRTVIGRELLECVRGFLPPAYRPKVRFYAAVGTALDFWHGIDGFFTIGTYVVTLDLSYVHKEELKADLLFLRSRNNIGLWRVGKEVADRIKAGYLSPMPKPDT